MVCTLLLSSVDDFQNIRQLNLTGLLERTWIDSAEIELENTLGCNIFPISPILMGCSISTNVMKSNFFTPNSQEVLDT